MGLLTHISFIQRKSAFFLSIVFSLFVFSVLMIKSQIILALLLAFFPLFLYVVIRMINRPDVIFLTVFTLSYFIMGLTRYIPGLQGGIVLDVLLLFTLFVTLLSSLNNSKIKWCESRNLLTVMTGIWLIYCILLVFNPETTLSNWATSVRGIAVYLFVFPLLTVVLFNEYKYLKYFLLLLAVLTLLAVFKMMIQKYVGFDAAERNWLFTRGGSTTHLVSGGTRYFSFFTDAANFGGGMGMAMVIFFFAGLYIRSTPLRFFYISVALLAGYAMMLSGTRAAIAVPFAGFAFFILLSKNWRIIILGIILFLFAFVFFKFTYIGHGNYEIRRMRSAFNVTQDASFQVRLSNQAKMRTFMQNHPLGIGIGKAKRAEPGDYMYNMATDTSLVYIWVETGIVGVILFLSIYLVLFVRGTYDVLFRIKNNELRGLLCALLSGIAGMLVCSYANETLLIIPNGPIVYISMGFIFMGRKYDRSISNEHKT